MSRYLFCDIFTVVLSFSIMQKEYITEFYLKFIIFYSFNSSIDMQIIPFYIHTFPLACLVFNSRTI